MADDLGKIYIEPTRTPCKYRPSAHEPGSANALATDDDEACSGKLQVERPLGKEYHTYCDQFLNHRHFVDEKGNVWPEPA